MAEQAIKTPEKLDSANESRGHKPRTARAPSDYSDSPSYLNANSSRNISLRAARVKPAELILFTTQLSVMLDSGVVLSDALDAIAAQAEQGSFKMIIMEISEKVKSGDNFSKVLAGYPRVFNSMFISIVKASEASGKMAEMLQVLSSYLDFELETRNRVKGALTYPFIMALVAVASTGTLMFFVLPRFMKIYEARGAALPKLTQVLVGFSQLIRDFETMTIIMTVLIFLSVAFYYWARSLAGKRIIDYMKISIPVLGTMFIDLVVTRSMRIMATMLNTGVSLLDALEVMQGSCENYYFQQLWSGTDGKIRDGYQFSESVQILQTGQSQPFHRKNNKKTPQLIAPGVIQMLQAGEKSGKLGQVCDKISVFYEKKLQTSIKSVTTLIEPLMIVVLGAIIGTIAIALLLPVFKISSVIAH